MRRVRYLVSYTILFAVVLYVQHAQADGSPAPAASTADAPADTLMLGDIKVTGQKEIVKTPQAIKTALKQPVSTDKAPENDVVCRIGTETGARARQYLICATNKQLTHQRYMVQSEVLEDEARVQVGEAAISRITAHQSQGLRAFRMPVNAQAFEQLLRSIPDAQPEDAAPAGGAIRPAPAASTQAVPAPSTQPQTL